MGYGFSTSDRSVQAGLRRIATEQIDLGIAQIDGPADDPAAQIHEMRKAVKKLRGLIRLARPGLDDFAAENRALRDTGRALAALRDSDVLLATHDRLLAGDWLPAQRHSAVRAHLAAPRAEHDPAAREAAFEAYRAAMGDLRERAARWRLTGKGRAVLRAGIVQTLRKARKTMAAAEASRADADLHDWRKFVKYHWYQTRLLAPVRPGRMGRRAAALDALGEDLGDHHDLCVYLAALDRAAPSPDAAPAFAAMRELAQARQALLEERAFKAGAALLSDDPDRVAARWMGWWRDWRKRG